MVICLLLPTHNPLDRAALAVAVMRLRSFAVAAVEKLAKGGYRHCAGRVTCQLDKPLDRRRPMDAGEFFNLKRCFIWSAGLATTGFWMTNRRASFASLTASH